MGTQTAFIFVQITDNTSPTTFQTNVNNQIQSYITSGYVIGNIDIQYQQNEHYLTCLIVAKG